MLEQAQKDSLTGFFTREGLYPFLESLILENKAAKKNFSVMLIDLNHFKKFNDKYGHLFGDEILKYATSTLHITFSECQCRFFRYGGDEFVGVLLDKGPKEALKLVGHCKYNLSHRPFLFKNKLYKIGISCGICGYPFDGDSPQELIKKADEAMYFSKRHGRKLIVLSGRINYLKLKMVLTSFISAGLIAGVLFGLYKFSLKGPIQSGISKLKDITVVTGLHSDTVILKSGAVFKGKVISESDTKVVLSLSLGKDEGTITFDKSDIAEIKYKSPR